jgi:hypothetical protein
MGEGVQDIDMDRRSIVDQHDRQQHLYAAKAQQMNSQKRNIHWWQRQQNQQPDGLAEVGNGSMIKTISLVPHCLDAAAAICKARLHESYKQLP